MTAVNLRKNLSPEETVKSWLGRTHPQYPPELVRVWEDEIQPELADPVHDMYNVVFFCDPEYRCLRVTGMALYGQWDQLQDPFPPPLALPAPVPFVCIGPAPVTDLVKGEATMDELKKRIDWILETHGEEDSPWVKAGDMQKEALTRQTVAAVPQEWVKEWYLWRTKAERAQFERICANGINEERAVQLMDGVKVVQHTVDDMQNHLRAFPRDRGLVTVWWEVGGHEVDASVMVGLPLYRGYKIHINFRHVGSYLAQRKERQEQSLKTRIWTTPEDRILPLEVLWVTQMEELSEYIHERSFVRVQKRRKVASGPYQEVDIEDIVMPPCVARLVGSGRFPQDQERQYFVRTMRAAKVPLDRVGDMLNDLNERFPHDSHARARDNRYENAKQRWDYVAHYEKGYKAPNCDDMCDYCPYSGSTPERKAQCHQVFQKEHPALYRPGDEQRFYNPASWIYWGRRHANATTTDNNATVPSIALLPEAN